MVGTTVPAVRSIRFQFGAVKLLSGDGDHRPYQGLRVNVRELLKSDNQKTVSLNHGRDDRPCRPTESSVPVVAGLTKSSHTRNPGTAGRATRESCRGTGFRPRSSGQRDPGGWMEASPIGRSRADPGREFRYPAGGSVLRSMIRGSRVKATCRILA